MQAVKSRGDRECDAGSIQKVVKIDSVMKAVKSRGDRECDAGSI